MGARVKNIIFYFGLVILLVGMIFLGKNLNNPSSKGLFGYKFYEILTGSMKPTINEGSLIVTKDVEGSKIEKEDIITFRSKSSTSTITTHRVKDIIRDKKGNYEFVTKGDANNTEDPMTVSEEQVIGKVVFKISYLGKGITFIKENILIVFGSVFIGYLVINLLFKKAFK